MTTDTDNLEAWARTQGYDPETNYGEEVGLKPGYVSEHFREVEFACNHCGKLHPDGVPQELVDVLERIRLRYGKPVVINSGYRCLTHNAAVGGATNSEHMKGRAADFWMNGVDPAQVYADLDNEWPNGGLGKYNSFTHIDVRGYKARWQG